MVISHQFTCVHKVGPPFRAGRCCSSLKNTLYILTLLSSREENPHVVRPKRSIHTSDVVGASLRCPGLIRIAHPTVPPLHPTFLGVVTLLQ